MIMGGYKFEGKVNSASDFNENSFEKNSFQLREGDIKKLK